jgi:hypothetical protein
MTVTPEINPAISAVRVIFLASGKVDVLFSNGVPVSYPLPVYLKLTSEGKIYAGNAQVMHETGEQDAQAQIPVNPDVWYLMLIAGLSCFVTYIFPPAGILVFAACLIMFAVAKIRYSRYARNARDALQSGASKDVDN